MGDALPTAAIRRLGEFPRFDAEGRVQRLAYARDGAALAAIVHGNLQVWDAATGLPRYRRYVAAGDTLNRNVAIAFSADGSQILTAGLHVDLWSATSPSHLRRVARRSAMAGFAASGEIAVCHDGQISLYASGAGRRKVISGPAISAFATSPDGTRCAYVADNKLVVVELATGKERWSVRATTSHSREAIVFSPDGTIIGACGGLWSVSDGKKLWSRKQAEVLAIGPDACSFVARHDYKTVCCYRLPGRKEEVTIADELFAAAFSPDGGTLALGGDRKLVIWDVATRAPRTFGPARGGVSFLAFAPDGRLAAGGSDVRIWDVDGGVEVEERPVDRLGFFWFNAEGALRYVAGGTLVADDYTVDIAKANVCVSRDGRWCVALGINALLLVDTDNKSERAHRIDVEYPQGACGTRYLAYWKRMTSEIVILHLPSLELAHKLVAPGWVGSVAFSPDDKTLYARCTTEGILCWDTETWQSSGPLPAPELPNDLVVSPDGAYLAMTCSGGTGAYALRLADRALLELAGAHTDTVHTIAWSPDGKLATGGRDQTIVIWDVARAPAAQLPPRDQEPMHERQGFKRRLWTTEELGRGLPADVRGRWDSDLQDLLERLLRRSGAYGKRDSRVAEVAWLEAIHPVQPVDEWRANDGKSGTSNASAELERDAERFVETLRLYVDELKVPGLFALPLIDAYFYEERFIETHRIVPSDLVAELGAYLGCQLVKRLGGRWLPQAKRTAPEVLLGDRIWKPFERARRFIASVDSALDFPLTKLYREAARHAGRAG